MYYNYIIVILQILVTLVSIAFFTLMERKILSSLQTRKGPNKISWWGILQPMSDALKLFSKENNLNMSFNKIIFQLSPSLMLILMLSLWLTYSFIYMEWFMFSMMYILLMSSLSVYGIMGAGWASNSKYALLGSYRSVAQVISYEIGMIFIILIFFIFSKNYMIMSISQKSSYSHSLLFGTIYLIPLWITILLAELNRAPFDFAESESELVSGFNIEYGSLKFALMFIAEYGNIMFMSYLTMILFTKINYIFMLMMMTLMILTRGAYPRYRYDILMKLNWKIFLPFLMINFSVYMLLAYNL